MRAPLHASFARRFAPGRALLPFALLASVLLLPGCDENDAGFYSFVVVSDSHTGGGPHTGEKTYRKILAMVNECEPDFVVHCGDWIVGPSYDEAGLATADTFFAINGILDSSIAFYPVLGNHEGDSRDYSYARSFFPVFGDSGWYSFDHGNSHFFVVENCSDAPDSELRGYRYCKPNGGINTPGSRQRRWLERDLASRKPGTTWTFGFGHRAYYGAEQYKGRMNVDIARAGPGAFCPFIEDAGVDVFFNGDQHCYTRTAPIRGGRAWTETDSSTVYLTCGGAGGRIDRGGAKRISPSPTRTRCRRALSGRARRPRTSSSIAPWRAHSSTPK
ncbi:MAG: metallophosphoesterase [Candidatus Eisenbacteria bacterium]|nr:metallophosphoesterase [Candidatus Eisenbacteria bacterium]